MIAALKVIGAALIAAGMGGLLLQGGARARRVIGRHRVFQRRAG